MNDKNNIYPNDLIRIITELCFCETDDDKRRKYDLIVVFGNNCPEITIDVITQKIIKKGLFLPTGKIILSGATGSKNKGKEKEAYSMYKYATAMGLDPSWFILEDQATNCKENITYSKQKITELGGFDRFESILFVGMAFMLRRTQMCAQRFGYPVSKIQYLGVVNSEGLNISADHWWEASSEAKNRVMAEVMRIGDYAGGGKKEDNSPKDDLSIFI